MLIDEHTYINKKGEVALELPDFKCTPFDNGTKLALVKTREGYGYININGDFVIQPIFELATPFDGGVARVVSDGKAGVISPDGKYMVKPEYMSIGTFRSGIAPAGRRTINGLEYGYIDTKGKTIIPFDSIKKYSFTGSVARVQDGVIGKDGRYLFRIKDGYIFQEGSDWWAECLEVMGVQNSNGLTVLTCRITEDKILGNNQAVQPGKTWIHVFNEHGVNVLSCEGFRAWISSNGIAGKTLFITSNYNFFLGTYELTNDSEAVFVKPNNLLNIPYLKSHRYITECSSTSYGWIIIKGVTKPDGTTAELPSSGEAVGPPDSDGLVPFIVHEDGFYQARFFRIGGDFVTQTFKYFKKDDEEVEFRLSIGLALCSDDSDYKVWWTTINNYSDPWLWFARSYLGETDNSNLMILQ